MIVLALSALVVMIALSIIDHSLRTASTPSGIISFELCALAGSCSAVVAAYHPVALQAGLSLGLDYLFIPLYTGALAAALVFVAARRSPPVRATASWLAWGLTLAAVLDAVENVALYRMLALGSATPATSWTASGPAALKLLLVALAIVALPIVALCPRRTGDTGTRGT